MSVIQCSYPHCSYPHCPFVGSGAADTGCSAALAGPAFMQDRKTTATSIANAFTVLNCFYEYCQCLYCTKLFLFPFLLFHFSPFSERVTHKFSRILKILHIFVMIYLPGIPLFKPESQPAHPKQAPGADFCFRLDFSAIQKCAV